MRKWICIALVGAFVVSLCAYWVFVKDTNSSNRGAPDDGRLTRQQPFDDGDAEASEVIEPLIVDRGGVAVMPPPPVGYFAGPIERALLGQESHQPARPDGQVRRMPYADEVEIPALLFDPVRWILETGFPRLQRGDDPAEQAEPMDAAAPIWHPHAYPHRPAPFSYRSLPHD